jgi:hypothetical protein
MRRLAALAAIGLSCAVPFTVSPRVAHAAEGSLADKAAAQTLFDEGRKLMAAGKFAEACPKLAESQKLDPGVGTQFNLSDCYERMGQTASAWAGFLEAASSAKAMGQADREKVARERAAALAPRLSKITITSAAASLAGLEIKRDGVPVGRALWGTAIPVDPGPHMIEATAPGKKPWQTTAKIEGEKANVVVSIPMLEDAPVEPATAQVATSAAPGADVGSPGSGRRTIALVIGGVGVVGLGVGTVFALSAKSKKDDSLANCLAGPNLCSQAGVDKRNEALSAGDVATVAMGAGAILVAAGVVLFVTAPSGEKSRAMLVPSVGPGSASLSFVGSY